MNEQPPALDQTLGEALFIQTLSGHSIICERPALESELAYNTLIAIIKADGYMVAGDMRIPWHAIAFIARGGVAQHFLNQGKFGPVSVAGMTPQGVA